eukprot:TRINITY_DN14196_c0_g1_i1.p1 TRINITY_DN14196_c0_g1~~TRINITY_DN14196_c0_g1_i1.p1  ORF type:complete len:144 (-),score=2.61 TRINITY_DN14196_c0_g1_i1:248-679(-)
MPISNIASRRFLLEQFRPRRSSSLPGPVGGSSSLLLVLLGLLEASRDRSISFLTTRNNDVAMVFAFVPRCGSWALDVPSTILGSEHSYLNGAVALVVSRNGNVAVLAARDGHIPFALMPASETMALDVPVTICRSKHCDSYTI